MNPDTLNRCPREGSWQRRQREKREAGEQPLRGPLPPARDPATRKTQRDAFIQGCQHIRRTYFLACNGEQAGADYHEALYRFPKELTVRRPRVVRFPNGIPFAPGGDVPMVAFRYVDGRFESQDVRASEQTRDDAWVERHQLPAKFITLLSALQRDPVEEVPA